MNASGRDGGGRAGGRWRLLLFVAGITPAAERALGNLKRICDQHLVDRYALEVVDIRQHTEMAEQEQIVAVPMLVRQSPPPRRKIIGDFSQTDKVLVGLDLEPDR